MATLFRVSPYLDDQIRAAQLQEADDARIAAQQGLIDGRYNKARVILDPLPNPPHTGTTDRLLAGLLFGGQAVHHERISVGTTAVDIYALLADDVKAKVRYCVIMVEANTSTVLKTKCVRYREDGGTPTSLIGFPVGEQGVFQVRGPVNMRRAQFVSLDSNTQILQVSYYS